ncbi:MAG: hypothetical protein KatS3mg102_1731 [Planctomycetota bacterium]|nr:MAG: hypothetical protein KatS3mg102_1731 [Planctomycetota bacterium]
MGVEPRGTGGRTPPAGGQVRDDGAPPAWQEWVQAGRLASLGNLIAGITHELNNPLAVISGFAELLLAQTPPGAETREMIEAIHAEAQRCTRIVHNLMTFARQRRPTLTPLDLNEIVRDVLELYRFKLSLEDITTRVELAPELPLTLGDLAQLQQVVLHLVGHAQAALHETTGTREIRIATRSEADSGEVVLEVEHTGASIPEERLLELFEPFPPLGAAEEEWQVGLALCYVLVRQHRGRLEAGPRAGGGMRFAVRLAAGTPGERGTPPDVARRRALAAGKGVLIVDDEPRFLGLIQRVLTAEGYRCATARDGAEALRMLASRAYDLIVLDIRMPTLDGIAFFREVERQFPELAPRILITSGDTATEETKRFCASLPNPVLHKPFEVEQLVRAIAELAATAGPRRPA